jgi:4-amino-4-deoxy-L-arabinose transferase-like glycosyltransferase
LYHLDAPGVLIDREYLSAIIARDFYMQSSDTVAPWRVHVAHVTREKLPYLEPPVTEWLVSVIDRVVDGERLWPAHLLTSLLWVIGGVFFYAVGRSLVSTEAALVGAAYYLLCPFGILVSRSFQPDSLMMLLFLGSVLGIVRYHERPTTSRLIVTAIITGVAILYRPLILFACVGAFVVPAVQRLRAGRHVLEHTLLFLTIGLSPALLYYGYGTIVAGHFGWKLESSFQPWLLMHREYWTGWSTLAVDATGLLMIAAALLGAPMLRVGLPRAIVFGLGAGYIVFGLLFTMHIHTHGYYHAQLVPIAALAAGPVITLILRRLQDSVHRWWGWMAPVALVLALTAAGAREVRSELGRQRFESPAVAGQIGSIVNHSSRVVFLAPYYGMPLQYYGEFTGAYWPRSITYYLRRRGEPELTVEQRLGKLGFEPEYFVITAFPEFKRNHLDLQEYLAQHWTLAAESKDYLIYRQK